MAPPKQERRSGVRTRLALLCGTLITALTLLLQVKDIQLGETNKAVAVKNITTTQRPRPTISNATRPILPKAPRQILPEACRAYIQGNTLSLQHGRYIHIPGRQAPYDHNSCFLLKPRYNCATLDPTKPKAYEWKLILQSNTSDESTICDFQQVVHDLGGPMAIVEEKQVAMFGNSFMRQMFESMACKYQDQLTEALVTHKPPNFSLAALEERGSVPFEVSDFGGILSLPLDKRPIPRCSGASDKFDVAFEPGINLTTPHYTEFCSDDLAMMEFNKNLRVYYNFHPERLRDTIRFYQEKIGLNVSELSYVAFNMNIRNYFQRLRAGQQAVWANWNSKQVMHRLSRFQRRDAGRWFGAENPFITNPPDVHPCLPGLPDDEVALFLFSIIFNIQMYS